MSVRVMMGVREGGGIQGVRDHFQNSKWKLLSPLSSLRPFQFSKQSSTVKTIKLKTVNKI